MPDQIDSNSEGTCHYARNEAALSRLTRRPWYARNRRLVLLVTLMGLLGVGVAIIVPAFMPVNTSQPHERRGADAIKELIEEALCEAMRAGSPLPRTAAQLRVLIATSDSSFLVEPSVIRLEDPSPDVVRLHIDTPDWDRQKITYRWRGAGEFELVIDPEE